MDKVTQLLSAIEQGEPQAAGEQLPLVYDELRRLAAHKLAHEEPGQTLDATALVHETYLRLVGERPFRDCGHFFAAAAEAMRRILVERARRKRAAKCGGGVRRFEVVLTKALPPLEASLSADHPGTLDTKKGFALVYLDRGKYAQAEMLLKKVLAVRTAKFGPDDPVTLASKGNLALLYQDRGKYAQAEALYKEAAHWRNERETVQSPPSGQP
jgi:tetratricopeptide (TPR) repeat protein